MFGRSSFPCSSAYSFCGKVIGDGRSRESQDFRASCVPLSRLRSFSTGPILHRRFDRDAISRGWLAGLRNHQAPAGPWPRRARAISSRHPPLSRGRTRGGPFRAPQTHRLLLLRVCTVLSPAAFPRSARNPYGLSDLCRTRIPRRHPVPERPGEPRFAPTIGPRRAFSERDCLGLSVFQFATILGPSLGGVVYAAFRGPSAVYALGLVAATFAVFTTLPIKTQSKQRLREPVTRETILAGLWYIWREKVILGAISLDLFAVLLGGSVALLPVYAREILQTGPWGLGLLRSAPGVGAAVMAILLAYKPLKRRAGMTMLWCVAGFGVATILFAVSRSLIVSLAALFLVGATDMVSVIVRQMLIQLGTPDEMRGRVNAVDMVFIGASNELGQFESGLTAQWFGTVHAVVLGGIGTLAVTALWAWRFPELRRADNLTVRNN